jgi:hypothetical protein
MVDLYIDRLLLPYSCWILIVDCIFVDLLGDKCSRGCDLEIATSIKYAPLVVLGSVAITGLFL